MLTHILSFTLAFLYVCVCGFFLSKWQINLISLNCLEQWQSFNFKSLTCQYLYFIFQQSLGEDTPVADGQSG